MVDRTRSRLDIPMVRTLFGSKGRPHRPGNDLSPRQAVVIEKPRWNLTIFKVHFGLLTLKAYTKGERVLRFEAIAHHTKQLGCGRRLDKFPQIIARLTGMVDRFTSMLDCVEIGFLPDGILDQLPTPSKLGATRTGGLDMNLPRVRAALAATLALAVAPAGFTVAEFTAKVRAMTGQAPEGYSVRQAAYDLRKLRGKQLVITPGRTRRYHLPELAGRTIAALLTLRDKVIAPLAAGTHTPRQGRPPKNWTTIDRDYETLRRGHANPTRPPRHRHRRHAIDNILSISHGKPLGGTRWVRVGRGFGPGWLLSICSGCVGGRPLPTWSPEFGAARATPIARVARTDDQAALRRVTVASRRRVSTRARAGHPATPGRSGGVLRCRMPAAPTTAGERPTGFRSRRLLA
jgi:hypothetical protein